MPGRGSSSESISSRLHNEEKRVYTPIDRVCNISDDEAS